MPDLHARLLTEIERREPDLGPFDDPGPLTTAMMHEHAYLGALRGVVELHASHPVRYIHQDGTWTEAPACNTCDCEDGDYPCATLLVVAEGLGVDE